MGKKLKLSALLIMIVIYFFLVRFSGFYSPEGVSASTFASPKGADKGCADIGSKLSLTNTPVQGDQEDYIILITSLGNRYKNNTQLTIPEGTKVTLYVFAAAEYNLSNLNISIDKDERDGSRIELDIGTHKITATIANSTLVRIRVIQVITQEEYQALQAPKVEPYGLRLKAALVAAFASIPGLLIGARIKHKRGVEYEL